jgi:hypothetical protein
MDKNELLALYDQDMRLNLRIPEMIYEDTGRIVRDYSLAENSGFIDYSILDETCADAEIKAQMAYFEALGLPVMWKVFNHDRPSDLPQRLAAHGFKIDKPESLMILDIQDAPDFYWSMVLSEPIKRITDAAGIEGIVRMEEEVWQCPEDTLRQRLLHIQETDPERMSLFAVPLDGRTVSAAWVYYYPSTQFASLLGGSTLPEFRKRGYYTSLLVTRVREARQKSYRFLTVDASQMSAPVLAKHGFQCLGFSNRCRWSPKS